MSKKPRAMPIGEVVSERVRSVRERRGLTQQQLADRMSENGAPLDRSTIAKIESRTRGVSAEEVVWLALALGCSPSALLVPTETDAVVAVAPGVSREGRYVFQWLRGIGPLGTSAEDKPAAFFDAMTEEVTQARRYTVVRMLTLMAAALEVHAANDDYEGMRDVLREVAKVPKLGEREVAIAEAMSETGAWDLATEALGEEATRGQH